MGPLAPPRGVANAGWRRAYTLQEEDGWRGWKPRIRLLGRLREAGPGLSIGLAMALLIPLLLHFSGGLRVARGSAAGAAVGRQSRLGLTARPEAGQLIVSWDWESPAVKAADKAVLSITDGGRTQGVELDLAALRGRRLAYSPVGGDVSIQLAVGGSPENAPESEWVRVIAPRGFSHSPVVPEHRPHSGSR